MINPLKARKNRISREDLEWISEHGNSATVPCKCRIQEGEWNQCAKIELVGDNLNIVQMTCDNCHRVAWGYSVDDAKGKWMKGKINPPENYERNMGRTNIQFAFTIGVCVGAVLWGVCMFVQSIL